MMKVDMHVHSTHSKHPSEWILQRLGARESYTSVEEVYRLAKARGIKFVTLTDHNTLEGALELHRRHPKDTFVSVEVTACFPENGCRVHVLVYDLTEAQFEVIQGIRANIYELRDYLRSENLTCSVAHATYGVNGRLDVDILEKLILLFDVFEGINGARSSHYNERWMELLRSLTPDDLEYLFDRHGIHPWGDDSWIKGFTGGSDDHSGLFIGETCTLGEGASIREFLSDVRRRKTSAGGRHGGHKTLAFAIYKIACDFSRHKGGRAGGALISAMNSLVFTNEDPGFRERLALRGLQRSKDETGRLLARYFRELSDMRREDKTMDERIQHAYEALANFSDGYFSMIARSLQGDMEGGDSIGMLRNLSASLPAVFLSAPFITTLHHMHQDRRHLDEVIQNLKGSSPAEGEKRVLWFTDTLTDLNGVAVTMQALARTAGRTGRPLHIVTSLPEEECRSAGFGEHLMNLPCVYTFTPSFYNAYTFRIPSLLKSIDRIAAENPDEIVISTPGPVGLTGLLAAKLLRVKCTGVYHTDFKRQADQFIGDEWVSSMVEAYTRSFYGMMDEIRVPTYEYMHILAERGLDRRRMKEFRRGVVGDYAVLNRAAQHQVCMRHGLREDAPILLWAGRMGREKNLHFLADVFDLVRSRCPAVQLILAGDGPEREALERRYADVPQVVFAGRVAHDELPHYYGLADLLVFPSTTDTFGMVVLEAQACGLPALVTDVGGPQEIVKSGNTGRVLSATVKRGWVEGIVEYLEMKQNTPERYAALREKIRNQTLNGWGWERVLDDMIGPRTTAGRHQAVEMASAYT